MKQRNLYSFVRRNSSCQYAIHVAPATTWWCAFTTFTRNGLSRRWQRWQHEYRTLAIGVDKIVLVVATLMGFVACGR
jgi:hypothetical protein